MVARHLGKSSIFGMRFFKTMLFSDFNESKTIFFTTYNWVLFGGIFSLIANFGVNDTDAVFIINSMSILIPQLLTFAILILYKVYFCSFHPDQVKDRKTQVVVKNDLLNSSAKKKNDSNTLGTRGKNTVPLSPLSPSSPREDTNLSSKR